MPSGDNCQVISISSDTYSIKEYKPNGTLLLINSVFVPSGRTEEEVRKKAAERFNVSPEKISLKQGTHQNG